MFKAAQQSGTAEGCLHRLVPVPLAAKMSPWHQHLVDIQTAHTQLSIPVKGGQAWQWASALQVDFLLSRLSVMKERVEATQALVAIDLDQRRNELVAFDLVRLGLRHEQQCLASRAGTFASISRQGSEACNLHSEALFLMVSHLPQRLRLQVLMACLALILWARVACRFLPSSQLRWRL